MSPGQRKLLTLIEVGPEDWPEGLSMDTFETSAKEGEKLWRSALASLVRHTNRYRFALSWYHVVG